MFKGGNSSHQEVLTSVERYSFDEDKWTSVASMTVPRASPAVASADGILFVGGGDQVRPFFITSIHAYLIKYIF